MARNTKGPQLKLRRVMLRMKTWLDSHGLDLAMQKIELLLITGCHILLQVNMSIGNVVIRTKNSVSHPIMYVKYYATQMLSGHEYFGKYLHRKFTNPPPYCLYEEGEVIDYLEHSAFECTRWHSYRSVLTLIIRTIWAANVAGVMIASRENLVSVANYVERILRL